MSGKVYLLIIRFNKKVIFSISILALLVLFMVMYCSSRNAVFVFNPGNLSGKTIVIDPGHGGIDGGTHDGRGFLEKDINLEVALKVKSYLKASNAKVIMTREKDVSLENKSNLNSSRYRRDLNARKSIVNNNNTDVFVSIHVNANPRDRSDRGAIVFYYPNAEESKKLAQSIAGSINNMVYKEYLNLSSINTPVYPRNLYILRETKTTGVLVEIGFITNPQDKKLLQDEEYKKRMAIAICNGVIEYLCQ